MINLIALQFFCGYTVSMTFTIFLMLVTVAAALVLFSIETLPVDVTALGVLFFMVISGLLPASKAFAGFGSDAVIVIIGLLIMTAALTRTGVVEAIGRRIIHQTNNQHKRIYLVVMVAAAVISSFISNTAATALFVPIVIGLAKSTKTSSSKLLMPLAFASILSSSVTLVASSTNIVVSGLMIQSGLEPIGMFELTLVGIPILLVGLLYMAIIGRRLIPDRVPVEEEFSETSTLSYMTEVVIPEGSHFAGKTLQEARMGRELDLTVVRVIRERHRYLAPQADLMLQEGDRLLVEGPRDEILKIQDLGGIDLQARISDPTVESGDVGLVEAILLLRSPLIGRTLRGAQFRERYGLQVLAINRHGENIRRKISQVILQLGDVLLIQGNRANIAALEADQTFRLLGAVEQQRKPNHQRAPYAIAAFAGALFLATFNLVTLPVAVLAGVLIVFLSRSITPEESYREVEWKAVILIGAMLGVGAALDYTGTASYLAHGIVQVMGGLDPRWLLTAFFVLTMLLTQPMSNQAAAAVVVPIAMQTAMQMGVNPRTFAIMIAVGASCSFLTPLEPSCLLVYGPGRYKFADFLKVGFLLTIIIYLIAIWLVPIIWPL